MSDDQGVWDVKRLAEYLQFAEITIRRWAKAGKVPGFKLGGKWYFRRAEIEKWLDEHRYEPED